MKHQINLQQHCEDAKLIVRAEKGKAVMWYNHLVDDVTQALGQVDEYSLHGGCPVIKGDKWIANFWINIPAESRKTSPYSN